MFYKAILNICFACLLVGCGSYFNQPFDFEAARLGEESKVTTALKDLPLPAEPVVVGVYKFRDQTGQYKPTDAGNTFSTAITQGATTILIKALEDSKWFVPIERENLSNLLNERNIIRSTRKEYQKNNKTKEQKLPPLLYAGVILEGGIISYDSNIITGGLGARYFGIGGSTQYRQDQITVYLRAVSTSSGKILKTVYVSKTILSQALDANFFRYVKFRRLLEAETGFTRNEPTQLAVKEAIEKAVESLIIEGVLSKLWSVQSSPEEIKSLTEMYKKEREEAVTSKLFNRYLKERRTKSSVFVNGGSSLIRGDYKNPKASYHFNVGYRRYVHPYINLSVDISKFQLENENTFSEGYNGFNVNASFVLLPYDKLSPYIISGFGIVNRDDSSNTFVKAQYGIGLEHKITPSIGLFAQASHHLLASDNLDDLVQGKRNDQYLDFSFGLNWYLDPLFKKKKE